MLNKSMYFSLSKFLEKHYFFIILIILSTLIILKDFIGKLSISLIFLSILLILPLIFKNKIYLILIILLVKICGFVLIFNKIMLFLLFLAAIVMVYGILLKKIDIYDNKMFHLIAVFLFFVTLSLLAVQDYSFMLTNLYELIRTLALFIVIIVFISNLTVHEINKYKNAFLYILVLGTTVNAFNIISFYLINPLVFVVMQTGINIRSGGFIQDPNYSAMIIVSICPVTFTLFRYEKYLYKKLLLMLLLIIQSIGIILTLSRAGLITLIVFFIILLFFKERKNKVLWICVLSLFFVFLLFFGRMIFNRIELLATHGSTGDRSTFIRLKLIEYGIKEFIKNPIIGIGFGDFAHSMTFYLSDHTIKRLTAHNMWIQVLAETGIFGFIAFVTMIVYMLRYTRKKINQYYNDLSKKIYFESLEFSLWILLIPSTFLSVHHYYLMWSLWALVIGISTVFDKEKNGGLIEKYKQN